jgi:hypothetical protein
MDEFAANMDLGEALQLYLFLEPRMDELPEAVARLHSKLRAFLYDHLSIEEMESPEALLASLHPLEH